MKIALIADTHLGVKKSDKVFQDSQMSFFKEQFVPELKERNIDTIAVLGDVFDTRQSVNTNTMNVVFELFSSILKDFTVHVLVGNHDLYYTTTTDVNSLKWIGLLPNVHLYEAPTRVKFADKEVLMLPWVTNYEQFEEENVRSEYLFAHLDVCGMKMDKYNFSTGGSTINGLFKRFDHIYTGHYHTPSTKTRGDKNITYVGSPYQITRMDMDDKRGYTILDLDNNSTEFVENTKSIKFKQVRFPNEIEDIATLTKGNVVDVLVKYEDSKYSKKIYEYTKNIEQYQPAYPVNVKILQREDVGPTDNKIEGINLFELIKEYIAADSEIPEKDKSVVNAELMRLYTEYKGQ